MFLSILVVSSPYLTLGTLIFFLHIFSFKCLLSDMYQQVIQSGDYAFPIDLKDAYLCIPIV